MLYGTEFSHFKSCWDINAPLELCNEYQEATMKKTSGLTPVLSSNRNLIFLLFPMCLFLITSIGCENMSPKEVKPKFALSADKEQERIQLRKELMSLEISIQRELDKVSRDYREGNEQRRSALHNADRKLKSNKSKIEKALHDIENANEANWNHVQNITRRTLGDIKLSIDQLAFKIEELFAKE
jgi:hypothetical protein